MSLAADLPVGGSLAQTPAYVVMLWALAHDFAGRLEFARGHRQKHVFVNQGSVLGVRSNLLPEGLDMVLGRGILPAADVASLQAEASRDPSRDFDRGIASAAVRRRFLDPARLRYVLGLAVEERLLNLMGWFEGEYALKTSDEVPALLHGTPSTSLRELFQSVERFIVDGESKFKVGDAEPGPSTGDLRASGGAALLAVLCRRKATGQLIFERGPRRKLFVFEDGRIVSAASTDPGETLAAVLKRWRYLGADAVDKLESTLRSQGGKFRQIILKERLLTEEDLRSALVTLHAERVLEAFSWRSGKYDFRGALKSPRREEAPPPPSPEIPVSAEAAASESIHFMQTGRGEVRPQASLFDPVFTPHVRSVVLLGSQEDPVETSAARSAVEDWRQDGLRAALVRLDPVGVSGAVETGDNAEIHVASGSRDELETRVRELEARYERLIWVGEGVAPAFSGRALFSNVIVDVKAGRTERERLNEILAGIPEGVSRYFFFRESAWSSRLSKARGWIEALGARLRLRHRS
ncbi:MAG: DUF4388 domain-containing protein [Pseudomonadota bacterium]